MLFIFFFYLFRFYGVQTIITQQLTSYVNDELNINVGIKGVKLKNFKNFELNEILIPDLYGDTIVYIPIMKINLEQIKIINNKYIINDLTIKDAQFNVRKNKNSEEYDYEYLLRNLNYNPEKKNSSLSLEIKSLILDNCSFLHFNEGSFKNSQYIDFHNFKLIKLNSLFNNISLTGNYLLTDIIHLSFLEKSGFLLSDLSAKIILDSTKINVAQLNIVTNNSLINTNNLDYFFNIDSSKNSSIVYSLEGFSSKLDCRDFNYFTESPIVSKSLFQINSDFNGDFNHFNAKKLKFKFGNKSVVNADLELSDFSKLNFMVLIQNSVVFKKDIEELKYYDENNQLISVVIPSNFKNLDQLNLGFLFEGNSIQSTSSFDFESNLGDVSGDFALHIKDSNKIFYDLTINANNLSGVLVSNDNQLDNFSSNIKIKGSGIEKENIDLSILGNFYDIKVGDNIYQDLFISGAIENQSFSGEINLDDKLLDIAFNGNINLNKSPYNFDFKLDVEHAYINKLGLVGSHPNSKISFNSYASGKGSNFDDFSGLVSINNIVYSENGLPKLYDSISIYSKSIPSEHVVKINSSLFSLDIIGKYHFDHLYNDLQSYLSIFLPNIIPDFKLIESYNENVNLSANIHDASPFLKHFYPNLNIANGTKIDFSFSNNQKKAQLSVFSDFIKYNDYNIEDINFSSSESSSFYDSTLNLSLSIGEVKKKGLFDLNNLLLSTNLNNNKIDFNLGWLKDDSSNIGDFDFSLFFELGDSIIFSLNHGSLSSSSLGNWKWGDSTNCYMKNGEAHIEKMTVSNNNQILSLFGNIGFSKKDIFSIELDKINLNNLTSFYDIQDEIDINGILDAKIQLSSLLGVTGFSSEILLDSTQINDYEIGKFDFSSSWDQSANRFDIIGSLINEYQDEEIRVDNCYYYPDSMELNQLIGDLQLDNFEIDFISPFLPKTILSDLYGHISGKISLNGNISRPILNGDLKIENANIALTEFNTNFSINGNINVNPNHIEINSIINDKYNTSGFLTAFYDHTNFSDYTFNVMADLDDPFLVMNNKYENNPLYYGDAFITGFTNIFYDSINGLEVNINAKTEENTILTIPLYGSEEVVMHDFISFKVPDSSKIITESFKDINQEDDFNLNIDLDITESAEIQLVFDEMVGDIMTSKGNGNIRLSIDKYFDLSMFGKYIISEGDYSFTLKDFINKKFIVEQGGEITWFGDPYNANLNLYANYPLKTSLYNIMPLIDRDNFTHKSEVNVKIHLLNDLLNPDIGFDIELPKANESAKTSLKSLINNEEEMNKQVFSLMILNQFVPQNPDIYSDNSNQINGASTTEALGNQLGNMISSFTDEFEIGFNYSVGDVITNNELSLAMSTQQFNDRLKINTNLGVSQSNELSRNPSSFIGDVDVEYKVNPKGNFRIHVYNESNEYDLSNQNQSNYTQGLGAFYKQSFDSGAELICEMANIFRSKQNKCNNCSDPDVRKKQKNLE